MPDIQWMEFIQDKWYIIAIALIVVLVVVKLVKTVIKWVLILIIVAGVAFYAVNYSDQLVDLTGRALGFARQEVVDVMKQEMSGAEYEQHADGTYRVTSSSFQLDGSDDEDELMVTFKGYTFKMSKSKIIEELIEEAKK